MRKISSRLLAAGFALLLLRDGLSAAVNAEHESPHVPADRAAPDDVCGTDRHLMVADARPPRPAPRAVDAAEESGGTPARAAFAAPLQFTGSDYTLTISASGLVANLVVPASVAGTLATATQSGFSAQGAGLTRRIFEQLNDSYDFILLTTDQAELPAEGEYYGITSVTRNDTRGLGKSLFDNTGSYGSAGRLQAVIHLAVGNALSGGPSLHEILHRWGNSLRSVPSSVPAHWGFASIGGQLGGWAPQTLRALGNNRYTATSGRPGSTGFGTFANGGNAVPYSPLELYLMGLIPASEVPEIQIAENADFVAEGIFTATAIRTVTMAQLTAMDGLRTPDYTQAQKAFRALQVVVTSTPLAPARWAYFETSARNFSQASSVRAQTGLYNFWDATGGRATIDLTVSPYDVKNWRDIALGIPPAVAWGRTSYFVDEQEGAAVLTLSRRASRQGSVSVAYTTQVATATAPSDFTARSGVVTWADGDISDKTLAIPIAPDETSEGTETFRVMLADPVGGTIVGDAAATVTIADAGVRDPAFAAPLLNNWVSRMLPLPGGDVLVGGYFTTPGKHLLRIGADGVQDTRFDTGTGMAGSFVSLSALAAQPDGRILVAGGFSSFGGVGRSGLVRLKPDGSVDGTFNPVLTNPAATDGSAIVYAVLIQPDGRIVIGGSFTRVNGVPRKFIARLLADGRLDESFVGPDFAGESGWRILCLAALPDGRILAGGNFFFANVSLLQRASLCRMRADGQLDATFAGSTASGNSAGLVNDIVVQPDGRILIGGLFAMYNQNPRRNIARIGPDGTLDSSFEIGAGADSEVSTLALQPDGKILIGGSFTSFAGRAIGHLARLRADGSLDLAFSAPGSPQASVRTLALLPEGRLVFGGEFGTFQGEESRSLWSAIPGIARDLRPPSLVGPTELYGYAGAAFSHQIETIGAVTSFAAEGLPAGLALDSASGIVSGRPESAGKTTASLTVSNLRGSSRRPLTFVIEALGAPRFTVQPAAQSLLAGQSLTLVAEVSGSPAPAYQWFKDGVPIAGATAAIYTRMGARAADAGVYTVVATGLGGMTSAAVPVVVAIPPRLSNLSVLTRIRAPGEALLLGFSLGGGEGVKPLLLRAVGPSLAALGVNETVGDPRLRLLAGAVVVAENDNWGGAAALAGEFGAVGAFALSGAPSLDAALRHDVAARNSTVEITGSGGGTGTVLAEIYDATPGADFTTASPRLVNVSVRHALGDGLTAGFAIAGAGERTILIRAVGPTLADFGVAGAATDPRLTLHGADGAELAANDNWGGGATLRAAFTAVGAFPLPNPSRDAALLITLAPGTYTTRATAVDNARGPVLIEIYEVP